MPDAIDSLPKRRLSQKERILMQRRLSSAGPTALDTSPTDTPSDADTLNGLRRLTVEEIWSLFVDMCQGLDHLHRHGIIHCDLKPSNLLLNYDGRSGRKM